MNLSTAYQSSNLISDLFSKVMPALQDIRMTQEVVKPVPIAEIVKQLGFNIAFEKLSYIGFFEEKTNTFIINDLHLPYRQRFSLAYLLVQHLQPNQNDTKLLHATIELLLPESLVRLAASEVRSDMNLSKNASLDAHQFKTFLELIATKLAVSSKAMETRLMQLNIIK